ncbi:MAG TPA: alpha/beta fold hydrolase [Kofleriaceae bacterium]|nr:alpha/beta fold hydrolase [Kofleriaceae bacterium]
MRAFALVALFACSSPAQAPVATPTVAAPAVNTIAVEAKYEVTSEEVTFTAGERTIPGTIAAPKSPGRWPAVLLLAGSGPTDRDWNSPLIATKNGSGKLLATALAQRGAVVLRFDKAGSGKNAGPLLATWTMDTYRDEATAGLALLRARADVRSDRVFVAGHSEGGIHATRLAAIAEPPVSGVVYLASASRTMAETILSQIEKQLHNPLAMLSAKAIDQEMAGLRQAFASFLAKKPVDPQKASRVPQLQQLVAQLINPDTAAVTRALLAFDNAVEAAKLAGPFYVSAGGKDMQVEPERDAKRLAEALRAAGKDVTYHLSRDADHVLKHQPDTVEQLRANAQAAADAYNAEGRVLDADFIAALATWLGTRSR